MTKPLTVNWSQGLNPLFIQRFIQNLFLIRCQVRRDRKTEARGSKRMQVIAISGSM